MTEQVTMTTYRIDLAYDGTGFHGYARQHGVRTVQGELEAALFALTGTVETSVAGRTDKGVHATAQVVSFDHPDDLDVGRIFRSLNRRLGPEIAVREVKMAPRGFHARFWARSRSYRYLVLDRPAPDPFLARTSWHFPAELDVAAMDGAAGDLIGEHDFASLCRRAEGRSTVRRVESAGWSSGGDGLVAFDIAASSFCHQMVRSVVAICVDIGRGKLPVGAMPHILEAQDRSAGRGAAPPHGLTLVGVQFGSGPRDPVVAVSG